MIVNASAIFKRFTIITNKNFVRTLTAKTRAYDVVIIGGGAMGASTAYWLKQKCSDNNFKVAVIEKDFTYSKCTTVLSVGGIRQQFSLPENIQMSLFGIDFFQSLKSRFGPEADIAFTPNGYLILSSLEGAAQLESSFKLQNELGAKTALLSKNQLKKQFPWMNVNDVELGCLGTSNREGWFDPWALLNLFKKTAINLGAEFIQAKAINFDLDEANKLLTSVQIKLPSGEIEKIPLNLCVLAAGAESGYLASLMKISLPVERRKRFVYRFDCQGENAPGINSPLMIDYTGAYFRRDGNCYIGGQAPSPENEPETNDLDVDYSFFDETVWPTLARRIPAFNNIKVKSAWSGFYEYNTFDENGIIGPDTFYKNLYFATGFSGHGIQQSPAVGRAMSELILDGKFTTIDLTRLNFERIIQNRAIREVGIY